MWAGMTREQMRLLLRRHQDALNHHDVSTLASLYAEDAVLHSPMFDTVRGRVAIRESFERLFTIFPDYRVEMSDALFICEGDRAAEFSTARGTHSVELYGLPPTGHHIEYHAARLFTFHDRLIVSEQRLYDFGGVLERLEKTRLEQELSLASVVQHTLLGRTSHRGPFFEALGSSLPCRTIGGDFLEFHRVASGGFGMAVGDVSGKGPAAALVAAMLQGMFSIVAVEDASPSETLSRLNTALFRRAIEPRFATLVYGVLQPDGRFTYSNAGHNPPLWLSGREAKRLTVGGPILGVFERAEFPEETVTLGDGDMVLAFSDGVTDALSPEGRDFGAERVAESMTAREHTSASDVLEHLFATVRAFSQGTAQVDDVTVAVLRHGPPA